MNENYFSAIGYTVVRVVSGIPEFSGEAPDQATIDAICSLPDDRASFIVLALKTHAVHEALTAPEFVLLGKYQKAQAEAARMELMEPEFVAMACDAACKGQSIEVAAMARMNALKEQIPDPPSY